MFRPPPGARRRRPISFRCDALETRLLMATYTVTSAADSGSGTLRQAILNANASAGADAIQFNLSPAGVVHTISPVTLLPAITGQTTINGHTQPGYTPGRPLIQLSGNLNPAGGNGLMLQNASGSTIRALIINRFGNHGVIISGGTNIVVEGNWIGLSADGIAAAPNRIGVLSNAATSRFGGTTTNARNVVSGNTEFGLYLDANENVVTGNYVGTNAAGTAAIGNGVGVNLRGSQNRVGGTNSGERNVISGNVTGVRIGFENVSQRQGTGNVVTGNYIGTRADGTGDLGNRDQGVWVMGGATATLIGSAPVGPGNLISGNGIGVLVSASPPITAAPPPAPTTTRIEGNVIGLDVAGARLSNNTGVSLDAGDNTTVGGAAAGTRNVISGNGIGVKILGAGTTNAVVAGNYIGLKPDGTPGGTGAAGAGNSVGVSIEGSGANTIGGTAAGAGNVISNNFADGISVFGSATVGPASGNRILGNLIGTDPTGRLDYGNGGGIEIDGAADTVVGGATAAARNVISGNSGTAVLVRASGARIFGNYIGTNASGLGPVANGSGVVLEGSGNFVGGINAGEGNLISGNGTGVGVFGTGATQNRIQGNKIGTDLNGLVPIANTGVGVRVQRATGTIIGGDTTAARNVISGNGGHGVFLEHASNTVVRHNYIGVSAQGATGTIPVGNAGSGAFVGVVTATTTDLNNEIFDNVISGNRVGVSIQAASGNRVYRNLIGLNRIGEGAVPNAEDGVVIAGASFRNLIGVSGPQTEAANTIAGNDGNGVSIGAGANDNVVQNNRIGHAPASFGSAPPVGNRLSGVVVAGSNNRVVGNFIAFNDQNGVRVTGGANNALLRNVISNDGLGIDLGGNAVTPNDAGDADAGPNALQNFPVLTGVESDGTETLIAGTLNSRPNLSYEIELFSTQTRHPSGHGDGQIYLGSVVVTTDAAGNASFGKAVAPVTPGHWVTATATRIAVNVPVETSEFSASVVAPPVVDRGPRVTAVFVGGTAWALSFSQHLQATGRGESALGFAVPAGTAQLAPLPWGNVNRISVRFSEPVSVQQDDLVVHAALGDGSVVPTPRYLFQSFTYNSATRTATWQLLRPVRADRLLLDLNADGATGVKDLAGNALDGEWADGAGAYPSGDRTSGGDFRFRLNVQPGDAARNGSVDALDLSQVRRRYGATAAASGTGGSRYSVFADLDADGRVGASDLLLARNNQRRRLPPPPAAP